MSNREEIQITDLEPSIEGGQDIEYIVQIRGIDATGRPGPWSEELKFTSPQQIPSLQSFNYVPGEDGWRLDNDGTFEVNDGTIRGTLESSNYVPDVSGWRLSPNGFAEFGDGIFRGALRIGQNTFNVDPNGNLFIGGSNINNSPFAVNTSGQIVAMSINAGFIQAGTIGANVVYSGTIVASQITSGTINGQRIPNLDASKIDSGQFDAVRIPNLSTSKITSGTFDPVRIPNLSADKITTGTLNANNVSIINLDADNITSGNISGDRITGGFIASSNIRTPQLTIPANGTMTVDANAVRPTFGPGIIVSGTSTFNASISNPVIFAGTGTRIVTVGSSKFYREEGSSIRYKKNVRPAARIENLLKIPAVYFDFKQPDGEEDESQKNVYGAIAETLDEMGLHSLVYYTNGLPQSIQYSHIGLALIPYVKELYDRIEELERKLNGS